MTALPHAFYNLKGAFEN